MSAKPVILIVDEHPEGWQNFQPVLDQLGCTLQRVASGGEALALVVSGIPADVILLHQDLPDMDARACLARLVEVPGNVRRVIVVCREMNESLRADYFKLGAADLLVQPFEAAELTARLRSQLIWWWLARQKQGGGLSGQAAGEPVPADRRSSQADAAYLLPSELLESLSQEIRTPLNAVLGMTELLLDTSLNPEQRDYALFIQNSGDLLLVLINDLLDYARLESGKLELVETFVDLRICLEDTLGLLVTLASQKHLNLAYRIQPGAPEAIVTDLMRLRQVLGRLLSLALSHVEGSLEQDELVVKVNARPVDQDIFEYQFRIRSSSAGNVDHKPEMVLPASQPPVTAIELSLEICRLLVEKLGGQLWLERGLERVAGYLFTIQAKASPWQPLKRRPHTTQALLGGKRLLLLASDEEERARLAQQLSLWQLKPVPAASKTEAYSLLQQEGALDAGLLAVHRQETSGLRELVKRLRQAAGGKSLPLLCLTGAEVDADVASLFAATLVRPVKPHQLYEALLRLFAPHPEGIRPAQTTTLLDPDMAQRHPLRVLLAEETLAEQKVIVRILERMGYSVELAGTAGEALQMLLRFPVDVLIASQELLAGEPARLGRRMQDMLPPIARPYVIALVSAGYTGDGERVAAAPELVLSRPVRAGDLSQALENVHPLSMPSTGEQLSPGSLNDPQTRPEIEPTYIEQFMALADVDSAALLAQLINIFTGNAARLLVQMHQAMDSGDQNGLLQAVGELRAYALPMGATCLVEACLRLEPLVKNAAPDEAEAGLRAVFAEYDRVKAALNRLPKKVPHETHFKSFGHVA